MNYYRLGNPIDPINLFPPFNYSYLDRTLVLLSLPQIHYRTSELFAGSVHLIKMFVQMWKTEYFVDDHDCYLHVAVNSAYQKVDDFDIVERCDGVGDDVDAVVDVGSQEKDLHLEEMVDRMACQASVDLFLVDNTCVVDVALYRLACEVVLQLVLSYEHVHQVDLLLQEQTSYYAFVDYTFHLVLQQEALAVRMAFDP